MIALNDETKMHFRCLNNRQHSKQKQEQHVPNQNTWLVMKKTELFVKNQPNSSNAMMQQHSKTITTTNTTTIFMTQTKNKNKRFNYQNSRKRQNKSWWHDFQSKKKKYKWSKHRRFAQTFGTHSYSHNNHYIAPQNKNKALHGWRKISHYANKCITSSSSCNHNHHYQRHLYDHNCNKQTQPRSNFVSRQSWSAIPIWITR